MKLIVDPRSDWEIISTAGMVAGFPKESEEVGIELTMLAFLMKAPAAVAYRRRPTPSQPSPLCSSFPRKRESSVFGLFSRHSRRLFTAKRLVERESSVLAFAFDCREASQQGRWIPLSRTLVRWVLRDDEQAATATKATATARAKSLDSRVRGNDEQEQQQQKRQSRRGGKAFAHRAKAPLRHFNALNRNRCGCAPSAPRRRFLSSSYSR